MKAGKEFLKKIKIAEEKKHCHIERFRIRHYCSYDTLF